MSLLTKKVYDWETNYISPLDGHYLSKYDCFDLIQKSSDFLKINPPTVRLRKASQIPCEAVPKKWEMILADWGRTRVTVLHEMAHFVSYKATYEYGDDPHGLLFIIHAMLLYHKFLNISVNVLIKTLNQSGINIGMGENEVKKLFDKFEIKKKTEDTFSDIDF